LNRENRKILLQKESAMKKWLSWVVGRLKTHAGRALAEKHSAMEAG
jgi:hypothetical protein